MRSDRRRRRVQGAAALLPLLLFAACGGGGGGGGGGVIGQGALVTVQVTATPIQAAPTAFGMNLGKPAPGEAVQLFRNILPNPGFEAGEFQQVMHAEAGSTDLRVVQRGWDTSWNDDVAGYGQPPGFWDGAEIEFMDGAAKGRVANVVTHAHEGGRNVLYLDAPGALPATDDPFVVRVATPGLQGAGDHASADPADTAPASPGAQSMRLAPAPAPTVPSWTQRFDRYSATHLPEAGKLRIVEGNWHLELWAKGAVAGEDLRVVFRRDGETSFFDETIALGTSWQLFSFDTFVAAGADPIGPYPAGVPTPTLAFELLLPDQGGDVWVDDVVLTRSDDLNPTSFADPIVDRLVELAPGVLRFNGNQYGGTLANQLAEPHARRRTAWSPESREGVLYTYSLHEFLELCEHVGAEPWYCLSPGWSAGDVLGLADYLAAPADGFTPFADERAALGRAAPWTDAFGTIRLEFGNELWGSATAIDPFWGMSFGDASALGAVADDRFALLRSSPHFDPTDFELVIGAQYGDPYKGFQIDSASTNHDAIGIAPYFGRLQQWSTLAQRYEPLFARPLEDVTSGEVAQSLGWLSLVGQGTKLCVYEINFKGEWGGAPAAVIDPIASGQAGGIALPLHLLTFLRDAGLEVQCAFTALNFGRRQDSTGEVIRVHGLLRDSEATGRKRPTWLALELANRAIGGSLVQTNHSGDTASWVQTPYNGISTTFSVPYVHSFAFQDGADWRLVLFNLHLTETAEVTLDLVTPPTGPATRTVLRADQLGDGNEDADVVALDSWSELGFADGFELTLEPHSMELLEWN